VYIGLELSRILTQYLEEMKWEKMKQSIYMVKK
jgi:hypothetical protein